MATGNERNAHGKYLEELLASCSNHRLTLNTDETGADDGWLGSGLIGGGGVIVSIKNKAEKGELCLGSFKNIMDHDSDVLMIYGLHEPNVAHPYSIYALYLPRGYRSLYEYFGGDAQYNAVKAFVYDFEDYLATTDDINSKKYDMEWCRQRKIRRDAYFDLFSETHRRDVVIQPRPKRDHQDQHRLQCAIPRRKLVEITQEFCIAQYDDPPRSHMEDADAWRVFFDEIIDGIASQKPGSVYDEESRLRVHLDTAWEDRLARDESIRMLCDDVGEDEAKQRVEDDYLGVNPDMFLPDFDVSDFWGLGDDFLTEEEWFDELMDENDPTYDKELARYTYSEEYYEQLEEYSYEDYDENDVQPYGDDYYETVGYDALSRGRW